MSGFEQFKEAFSSKEKFYCLLKSKKITDKEDGHVLKVSDKFEMKTMKDYQALYLKCDVFLLADVFEECRSSSLKNMIYVQVIIRVNQLYVEMQYLIWRKLSLNLFQMQTSIYSWRKV